MGRYLLLYIYIEYKRLGHRTAVLYLGGNTEAELKRACSSISILAKTKAKQK